MQLELAAKEFVRRFAKQEDGETQAPAELQVFLYSSAQFGPSGMRGLNVSDALSTQDTLLLPMSGSEVTIGLCRPATFLSWS